MQSSKINYQSVEEIIERQRDKLSDLIDAHMLLQDYKHIKEPLKTVFEQMYSIKDAIAELRHHLGESHAIIESAGELEGGIQMLQEKLDYLSVNIPENLPIFDNSTNINEIHHYDNTLQAIENTPQIKRQLNFDDSYYINNSAQKPPVQPQIVKKPIKIEYLSLEEFNQIPTYMKGRTTREEVNSLVDKINKCIESKYSLLSTNKSSIKKKSDLDRYIKMKHQECAETKGKRFFTQEDLKFSSGENVSRQTLKLFDMLRHCKRTRELHLKGVVKYVVNCN